MNVNLARIQFAFTSINHFFFVPVTIGLAFLTALLQTVACGGRLCADGCQPLVAPRPPDQFCLYKLPVSAYLSAGGCGSSASGRWSGRGSAGW
jgi:bd-type cytochrome oxidase subunit I